MRSIAVEVSKELEQDCWVVAKGRVYANEGRRDIPSYDHRRFHLSNIQNNFLGVLAELAVCVHGELDYDDPDVWNMWVSPEEPNYKELIQTPDILNKFEVRHTNKPDAPLVVREKDVIADAIIVSVWTPHMLVGSNLEALTPEIIGWMPADEAWKKGYTPDWSRGGDRAVHNYKTRNPKDLKTELQKVDAYRLSFQEIVTHENQH